MSLLYTINLDSVAQTYSEATVDHRLDNQPDIAKFTLPGIQSVAFFDDVEIIRKGVTVFSGSVADFDYDVSPGRLNTKILALNELWDLVFYDTGYVTYTDATLGTIVADLIDRTPFKIGTIDSDLYAFTELNIYEGLDEFENYTRTNTKYVFDTDVHTSSNKQAGGAIDIPNGRRISMFWDQDDGYFYMIWYRGNPQYVSSSDGSSWGSEAQVGTAQSAGANICIWWDGAKIYMSHGRGTGCYFSRFTVAGGTISDDTDVNVQIVANPYTPGNIIKDTSGDVWVGTSNGVYKSVDDGQTWGQDLAVAYTLYLMPQTSGAIMAIRVTGGKLKYRIYTTGGGWGGEADVCDCEPDGNSNFTFCGTKGEGDDCHVAWIDQGAVYYVYYNGSSWGSIETVVADGADDTSNDTIVIGLDECGFPYIVYIDDDGDINMLRKIALETWTADPGIEVDGDGSVTEINRMHPFTDRFAIMFKRSTSTDYARFRLMEAGGISLEYANATGWFRSDGKTASGDMVEWGYLLAWDINRAASEFDVLRASDDAVLLNDVSPPVDLEDAGLSELETSIKLRVDFSKTNGYPVVYQWALNERVDIITQTFDYNTTLEGFQIICGIVNGELEMVDGVLSIYSRRGQVRSKTLVVGTHIDRDTLKNSGMMLRNVAEMIGSGDPPTRKEETVYAWDSYSQYGRRGIPIVRKDLSSTSSLQSVGFFYLEAVKQGRKFYHSNVLDSKIMDDIEIGDTVTLQNTWVGTNDALRIVRLLRAFTTKGEASQISFSNLSYELLAIAHMLKIDEIKRWIA